MIIHSVEIQDFRQYKGLHRFELGVDPTSAKRVIVVSGLNGTGKTSLLEAIRLTLFGKMNKDLWSGTTYSQYMGACLNRSSAAEGVRKIRLSVVLSVGPIQGTSSVGVTREWWFRSELALSREHLTVSLDGKEQTSLSEEEAQLLVLDYVPFEASQFIFFDGEKMREMAQLEVTMGDVRQSVEAILGVGLFRQLREDLRLHERELLRESAVGDAPLQSAMRVVDNIQHLLEKNRAAQATLRAKIDQKQTELTGLQQERTRVGNVYAFRRAEVDNSVQELRSHRERLKNELSRSVSDCLPLMVLRPVLSEIAGQLIREAESEGAALLRGALCQYRDQVLASIGERLSASELSLLEEELTRALPPMHTVSQGLYAHMGSSQKRTFAAKIQELSISSVDAIGRLTEALSEAEQKLRKAQTKLRSIPADVFTLELERQEAVFFESIQADSQQLGEMIAEERRLETELAVARRQEQAAVGQARAAESARARGACVQNLLRGLEDFIEELAATRAESVGESLNSTFRQLASKDDLVREFSIDKSSFAVTLRGYGGCALALSSLSAAEKELFALSFIWALGRNAVGNLPVIVDSLLGRLDSYHKRSVALEFIPHGAHQVVVLATDEEIDDPLYREMERHVARAYTLTYDQHEQTTRVIPGFALR